MAGPRAKKPSPLAAEERARADAAGETPHSPFDRWEIVEMHRRELHDAPYNARVISDDERRKLKTGIEKLGFLAPACTWNVRTGTIVGGHQRLANLDALMGTDDYKVRVCKVDLDEVHEREANILLNNDQAMGAFDLAKLSAMFQGDIGKQLDIEATGFEPSDLYRLFGDTPFDERDGTDLGEAADRLRSVRGDFDRVASMATNRDSTAFFTVIVHKDEQGLVLFHELVGLDLNIYQSSRKFWDLLGCDERLAAREAGEAQAAIAAGGEVEDRLYTLEPATLQAMLKIVREALETSTSNVALRRTLEATFDRHALPLNGPAIKFSKGPAAQPPAEPPHGEEPPAS